MSAEQTSRLEISISIEVGGVPLELGVWTSSAEHDYYVTFLSFFVGNFRLIGADGVAHAARSLDSAGRPSVYDVQLVNAREPETQRISLAAPRGGYGALRFDVGVSVACNALNAKTREWPLTLESEMGWDWTMLHFRIEGSLDRHDWLMYHLGATSDYRTVQVPASIQLSRSPATRMLAFEIDRLIDDASAPIQSIAEKLQQADTFELR